MKEEDNSEWNVETKGDFGQPGFDWSTLSRKIGNATKVRISIQAKGSAMVAFAESKEACPKRIVYEIGFDGNYSSRPKWLMAGMQDTPYRGARGM